jgi:hypothetical protein
MTLDAMSFPFCGPFLESGLSNNSENGQHDIPSPARNWATMVLFARPARLQAGQAGVAAKRAKASTIAASMITVSIGMAELFCRATMMPPPGPRFDLNQI